MLLSGLRSSSAAAAARRLRARFISTAQADNHVAVMEGMAKMEKDLKKVHSKAIFLGKLDLVLRAFATPVVAFLSYKIYMQSCELDKLEATDGA